MSQKNYQFIFRAIGNSGLASYLSQLPPPLGGENKAIPFLGFSQVALILAKVANGY